MDIITFVVPASLPAMLSIGTIYAQNRLEKSGIYCLSSPYINQSGILDIICFDKVKKLFSLLQQSLGSTSNTVIRKAVKISYQI